MWIQAFKCQQVKIKLITQASQHMTPSQSFIWKLECRIIFLENQLRDFISNRGSARFVCAGPNREGSKSCSCMVWHKLSPGLSPHHFWRRELPQGPGVKAERLFYPLLLEEICLYLSSIRIWSLLGHAWSHNDVFVNNMLWSCLKHDVKEFLNMFLIQNL